MTKHKKIGSSILDCVGSTPLIALDRFAPPTAGGGRVFGKLELMNPYSVKDRPALTMLTEAESRGDITPGKTTILEATSGNTGIGLAMVCAVKGYELVLCMSEAMSDERKKMLIALGARLELTPRQLHTKGARERVRELETQIPNSYYIHQHDNPDNVGAHVTGTAEELWEQTSGLIDVFVAGLGTCGTISGVSKQLRTKKAELHVVGVEPNEAPYFQTGHFEPHRIPGVVPGFTPKLYQAELIDEIVDIPAERAWSAVRELARTEGILAGISSGATAAVARDLAQRKEFANKMIVAVLADPGERYLSVEGLF